MGAFCCHGNQSFDPICLKTLDSLSLTPVMLQKKKKKKTKIKIGQVLSEIFKFESVDGDGGPLVYYKLTLWAFGSGELKTMCWTP